MAMKFFNVKYLENGIRYSCIYTRTDRYFMLLNGDIFSYPNCKEKLLFGVEYLRNGTRQRYN